MPLPRFLLSVVGLAAVATLAAGPANAADEARLPKPRPVLAGEVEPQADKSVASTLDNLAPLPRARPSIEPGEDVANWAEGAQSRFQETAAAAHPAAEAWGEDATAAIESLAPLPRPRPTAAAPELALIAPPRIDKEKLLVAPEDAGCIGRLRELGVAFSEEPTIDPGGSCPVPHPLKVTELGMGVAIGPETILNCAETESLALWVQKVVVPSAKRLLGEAPTKIVHDSAYVCRTRYNDPNQKISEHARANAIDIAAIGFASRDQVGIGKSDGGSAEAKFEAEIRKGSCDYFTTVLGPGSNAAHATHFHLDMAFRRGGYRLCEPGGPTIVEAPANTKRE